MIGIQPSKPVLEICVDNAEGLFAAIEGGADRIELCSALSVGGLTPSFGLMELAGKQTVPVTAMIRPRAGSFVFSNEEVDIMRADIDAARAANLKGVVLGANRPDGTLDIETLKWLCSDAKGLDLTLHRAFDMVGDKAAALEDAIDLGFSRILTSGGKPTAHAGMEMLEQLINQAQDRIIIMPGSGVRPQNASELLKRLRATELHASCSVRFTEGDAQLVELSFASREMLRTDASTVRQLKQILYSHVEARLASS
ncbi:copper homeostasis protein CutC [Rhizobium sp. Root149]|uniref:copper homeostasis protein CutC n=1 Tax=Rhizobium sp. Root149 TaxID=1736473 RepID=UPI0007141879|nr:copper homeostasis protein CutC [Rhizobium sp. Root149]KQZ48846.1 copper homeostasis protein CutC [Rhizobium sp. Root149]